MPGAGRSIVVFSSFPKSFRRGRAFPAVLLGALLAAASVAAGVTTSDDPDNHVVSPPGPYDMVGYINQVGGASGVLIGPRHVLTAKHVVEHAEPEDVTFQLNLLSGDRTYGVSEVYLHPVADLALLILAQPTGLPGYPVYEQFDEVGKTGILLGYGQGGTGLTGGTGERGTKRIAYNRIDRTSYPGYSYVIGYDFDQFDGDNDGDWDGDSLGETLEGLLALGDSGGALFINSDGDLLLAGIHSVVLGEEPLGRYGQSALDVRISPLISWIDGQVRGDANGDGRIDDLDFLVWSSHYKLTGQTQATGDFTGDGVVNGADYTLWADNYGYGTAGGARDGAFLPEPATGLLLLPGLAWLLRRRR